MYMYGECAAKRVRSAHRALCDIPLEAATCYIPAVADFGFFSKLTTRCSRWLAEAILMQNISGGMQRFLQDMSRAAFTTPNLWGEKLLLWLRFDGSRAYSCVPDNAGRVQDSRTWLSARLEPGLPKSKRHLQVQRALVEK